MMLNSGILVGCALRAVGARRLVRRDLRSVCPSGRSARRLVRRDLRVGVLPFGRQVAAANTRLRTKARMTVL